MVILHNQQHVDKIEQFIVASNLTKIKFSLDEYNRKIRKAIKSNPLVIQGDPERLFVMNYALPRLYGQIKMHKPDNPIRPVVAYYTDPSYLLAKYLASWFCAVTGYQPPHTVSNSAVLARNLSVLKFPAASILVSCTRTFL